MIINLTIKEQALMELNNSDLTILRCIENNIEVPKEWSEYRQKLRAIVNEPDTTDATLPEKPIYPLGTWKFEKYDN